MQKKETPKNETLARLVSSTREDRGLSQKGLALKANLAISLIDDIESGRDLYLSTTARQKLASALKITPSKIKSLEKIPQTSEADFELADKIEELKFQILNTGLKGHKCPVCEHDLFCRVAVMYDLENNVVTHPKARCSKCPFQIK